MESSLENILMNSYKDEMISFMNSHLEHFEEAVILALGDKDKLCWRAAWLLWICIEKDDIRIKKHINKIIKVIPHKKDGHQRKLIKILSVMKLNEEQEGRLFNICMNLWEGLDKPPSIRWTAFKFILEMGKKYPELKEEISFLTQDHYLETLSPGIRHSISKAIPELNLECENR
jgi:hypothetical protein